MLCQIFKTGRHTDSKGNTHDWTIEDLDKIVYQANNVHKDSPICVGHPQSNSPAYGWLKDVQRIGNGLYCDFKDVQKEFVEAVKKGLFKNRSISLDKDLNIRHLAFLGGQAPAIKGLEQFCFEADNDFQNIELSDFSDIQDKQKNTKNEREKEVEKLEEMQSQLAEKDKKIDELQKQIADVKNEQKLKEFEDFCDEAITKGNILPKHKESIVNILTACDKMETFNFSDSGEKDAVTTVKDFIGSLKIMNFGEIADKDKAKETQNFEDMDSLAIAKKISEMCKSENITEDVAYAKLKK